MGRMIFRLLVPLLAVGGALGWGLISPPRPPAVTAAPPPPLPEPSGDIESVLAVDPFRTDRPADPDATELHGAADDATAGLPAVVGIVGRLPDAAVVLVRTAAGGTRTLALGETIGRWRLTAIAADAALFTDGAHRERVELPLGDQ